MHDWSRLLHLSHFETNFLLGCVKKSYKLPKTSLLSKRINILPIIPILLRIQWPILLQKF